MGLYYQAILSSLRLNFFLDLQQPPSFPHNPPFCFFTSAFSFFSLFLPHYGRFQQVKKGEKEYYFAFVRAMYFLFYFLSHWRSPFFVRTVAQNCQKLTTIPKMVTSTPSPKRETTTKWQPSTFIAGALTVVSNSQWRMACPHLIDLLPSKLIYPHHYHPEITTNTNALTRLPPITVSLTTLCVLVACWSKWCVCVFG